MSSDRHRDFVLGIDFGGTKTALATADRSGRPLERLRLDTRADRGAEQLVARALGAGHRLIDRTAVGTGGRCLAAGVASPGIVRAERVDLAPNLPVWERLALGRLLGEDLGIPVVAGNDVKAAAEAEARWGSLRGADPAVFLSLGTGVAAALLVRGRVVRGAHGAAGEIGYNLRGVGDAAGAAAGRAPLEEFVGCRALGERGSRLLGRPLSAADLFAHPDARAHALVDDALAELATHVANLAVLIDPERIAVGGGLMGASARIMAALERRLRLAVPYPPDLVAARFPDDAPLRGAIALALDCVGIQSSD